MPRDPSQLVVRRATRVGGALSAATGAYQLYRAHGGQVPTAAQLARAAGSVWRRARDYFTHLNSSRPRSRQFRGSSRAGSRSRVGPYVTVRRGGIGGMYKGMRRYRKRRFIKKRRGKHNVGRGGLLKRLWKEMHCPQRLKVHNAFFKASDGHGLRTWKPFVINGLGLLNDAVQRAPVSGFFWESGSTTYGSATTQAPFGKCRALHMQGGYYKFMCQNRHNWDMHLKVYECIARHEFVLDVTNMQGNYFRNSASYGADNAGNNLGPVDVTLPTGNLLYLDQNVNFTPYQSSAFCSDFKILKCRNYKITANDYVNFKVRLPSKVFQRTEYERLSAQNINVIKGFTKLLLFTFVGGPVDTGKLTTDNKISTSAPTLTVQYDMELKFYFERSSMPLYTTASSNATATERDTSYGSSFSTATVTYEVPATETVQTVAGSAAGNEGADNVNEQLMAG